MLIDIITNKILIAVLVSTITAQLIKTILDTLYNKRFHWQSLFRGAGMPSSHTATVVSLSLAVLLKEGITTIFIVTLVFSAIVIRDVIGDKIFATHQENLLNTIIKNIENLKRHHKLEWKHLIGHSGLEVIFGSIIGIIITLIIFNI